MNLGFTGTRVGMNPAQRAAFRKLLLELAPKSFHHGDCIGSDAEAHDDVAELLPACKKIIHPPVDRTHQAHKKGDETREPKTHFARNRDIVGDTDSLVGVSISAAPLDRGGTWYTIHHAMRSGKPVHILWPDGRVTEVAAP